MFFLLLLKVYPQEEQIPQNHRILMENIENELSLYSKKIKHSKEFLANLKGEVMRVGEASSKFFDGDIRKAVDICYSK